MKHFNAIRQFLLLCTFALAGTQMYAQCTGGTNAGAITPTAVFQTVACIQGGQYYTFAATAGIQYTFSLCQGGGSSSFDSQITILNNAGAYAGGYNDDFCSLASEVTWTASSTGTFRVLVSQYNCTTNAICATLAYRTAGAAPAGSTCANAVTIPSIPFSQTGRTTCGFGNDYSSVDACTNSYMNGEDFVYAYNSPGNESITITLSNTGSYVGIFVLDGCPNVVGTNCIPVSGGGGGCASPTPTNTSSSGNPFGTFQLCTAGTYYFIIDTWPSPLCTAFDISITKVASPCSAGAFCYNISTPAYTPDPYGAGTLVTFPDDYFASASFPMGFQFCYGGNYYTDFTISSNGFISLNANCVGLYSTYVTTTVPNTSIPSISNAIMVTWHDIDPSVSGQIRYATYGSAPNRRLVVSFNQVAMFSAACNSLLYTGQIVLYETTNNIAFFIQNKPICPTWNSGNGVQGVTSPNGTAAVTTPGRNNTNWTITNDAKLYMPCGPICILPVTYTSFRGFAQNGKNELYWSTATELASDYFALEHSVNGTDFQEVVTVDSRGGQGVGAEYQATDLHPYSPYTYYRLKQVGMDGEVAYSETITIAADGRSFSLTNLIVDQAQQAINAQVDVMGAIQKLHLEVYDAAGKRLITNEYVLKQGRNDIAIDGSHLAAGYYLLAVSDGNGAKAVRRFVKY
jgi:hypothetical protein